MSGLLFILVLAVALALTVMIPPVGVLTLLLLVVWVVFMSIKVGSRGIFALLSLGRRKK